MDEYAGRVLAERYRLPAPLPDAPDPVLTRALDTYSGQDVLVRQVPLPEVVDAELVDEYDTGGGAGRGYGGEGSGRGRRTGAGAGSGSGGGSRADRDPSDPVVRRALEAATAAARVPDHPRLDQVFDVFAQDGSLWIVSELIPARPLSALLSDRTLSPHRAAEIAADILTALRALHAHGWTHRNITPRTVLVCDDGRVVLTGLAAGAAEEALCGYDPVPRESDPPPGAVRAGVVREWRAGGGGAPGGAVPRGADPGGAVSGSAASGGAARGSAAPGGPVRGSAAPGGAAPGLAAPGGAASGSAASGGAVRGGSSGVPGARTSSEAGPRVSAASGGGRGGVTQAVPGPPGGPERGDSERGAQGTGAAEDDPRRARAGAIAAYRAGARAAAARTAGPGNRSALPPGPPGVPGRPGPQQGQPAAPQGRPAVPPGPPGVPPGPAGGPSGRPGVQPGPAGALPGQPGAVPQYGPAVPPAPRQPAAPGSAAYGGGLPGPVRRPQGGTNALPTGPQNRPMGSAEPQSRPVGPAVPQSRPGPGNRPAGAAAGVQGGPGTGVYPGVAPGNALAAERARQARITVVGAVTERWAPEQAGPVHANWQLAPPVGPAADLWALGALLFRSVQGHAPYAEESAAELVQLVCARPPAHAEECGALRPVVESLLRQDPTERPDFEELRGWLRSLVRAAPEPEAGRAVVTVPALERGGDPRRLPIVRRRGELVRRGRHKKSRPRRERPHGTAAPTAHSAPPPPVRPAPPPRAHEGVRDHDGGDRDRARQRKPRPNRDRTPRGGPRRLGMLLLGLVLLLVVGAVLVAVAFLPRSGTDPDGSGNTRSSVPSGTETGAPAPDPAQSQPDGADPTSTHPRTTAPDGLADGFEMRDDPEGFRIAVHKGWQRHAKNAEGQVRYTKGAFTLLVVPGRDTAKRFGSDPMAYQQDKEAELAPFRDANWTSSSGLRRTDVGRTAMAEGTFTWGEDSGSATYARNMALLEGGRYHLVLVIGPDRDRAEVDRFYEQASTSFRP
ncbi:protein kinase domain-containing protein [Streptomyces ochraceiscleroticus]|uniref:Protein kinase n=1 Tax=Streptomyces ochraceiscleroticus TaxID=47761 RepID=A0ABW1MVH9_9ACTN